VSLVAAIYARKSTEQNVPDEQRSVKRQIDHARAYAEHKGWTVDDAYIYVDDRISGAEFRPARRPGFARLMAALTPRAPFQVLIMSEESRLGRESINTAGGFKQIVRAGVRVFLYLNDRELTLGTMMDNTMMFMRAEFAAEERRKASQRVKDTMRRNARAGQLTGGQCFGYDPVDVMRDGTHVPRSPGIRRRHPDAAYVDWVINEREAAVVRRIFALKAAGVARPS
jgi:DNA invertase Pin-like site-specific DNA recombinase